MTELASLVAVVEVTEGKSVEEDLTWRRHMTLWLVAAANATWLAASVFHAGISVWMMAFGGAAWAGLGAVSAACFVGAQVGLWFAVGEREKRRLDKGKKSRE